MDIDQDAANDSRTRRRSRKRPSILKCLGFSCILFTMALIGWIAFIVITSLKSVLDMTRDPHKAHFSNGTSSTNASAVVRPLIDSDTKFDIALTVWVRKANEDTLLPEIYDDLWDGGEAKNNANYAAVRTLTGLPLVEIANKPEEEVIFSQVIIEDFDLSSPEKEVTVSFDIPLKRFRNRRLYLSDVRSAFTINPRGVSLLDRVESYSDWRPEEVVPFPRLSKNLTASGKFGDDDSVYRGALEHMGVSLGLMRYFPVASECNTTSSELENTKDEVTDSTKYPNKPLSTPKQVHEEHPYFLTRSHIYIINETRLLNRTAFEEKHEALRKSACRGGNGNSVVSRLLCNRQYAEHGQWEVKFELQSASFEATKELAYSPFLQAAQQAAGPKHRIRLPVHRENCTIDVPSNEFITVPYTVRFSSFSPGRSRLHDFVTDTFVEHNATERIQMEKHTQWEQISEAVTSTTLSKADGLIGSPAEGTRPWTRLCLTVVSLCTTIVEAVLNPVYWYTRETTAGLSLSSVWFRCAGDGFGFTAMFSEFQGDKTFQWGPAILVMILSSWVCASVVFQIKTVFPFMVGNHGHWWSIRRWRWTHRERNTRRLEAAILWPVRIGLVVILLALSHYTRTRSFFLISPDLALHDTKVSLTEQTLQNISWAFTTSGIVLQNDINRRSKTFAGTYALCVYLTSVTTAIDLAYHSSWLVGRYQIGEGLHVTSVINTVLHLWTLWQALTLPKVKQTQVEEE